MPLQQILGWNLVAVLLICCTRISSSSSKGSREHICHACDVFENNAHDYRRQRCDILTEDFLCLDEASSRSGRNEGAAGVMDKIPTTLGFQAIENSVRVVIKSLALENFGDRS